jgi:hypothetical protein
VDTETRSNGVVPFVLRTMQIALKREQQMGRRMKEEARRAYGIAGRLPMDPKAFCMRFHPAGFFYQTFMVSTLRIDRVMELSDCRGEEMISGECASAAPKGSCNGSIPQRLRILECETAIKSKKQQEDL